jgi:hypothetical protein
VAGNDAVSVIDQDGIGKTKSPDGVGDLDDLLLAMFRSDQRRHAPRGKMDMPNG